MQSTPNIIKITMRYLDHLTTLPMLSLRSHRRWLNFVWWLTGSLRARTPPLGTSALKPKSSPLNPCIDLSRDTKPVTHLDKTRSTTPCEQWPDDSPPSSMPLVISLPTGWTTRRRNIVLIQHSTVIATITMTSVGSISPPIPATGAASTIGGTPWLSDGDGRRIGFRFWRRLLIPYWAELMLTSYFVRQVRVVISM